MPGHSLREMKMAVLEVLARADGHKNRVNLIGRPFSRGELEYHLNDAFAPDDRAVAERAIEQLKGAGLVRTTYADLLNPQDSLEITEAGRAALERRACDELDVALAKIAPHLADIRAGAWAAIQSGLPDSIRQAAHSGRELIDQVLKEGAPDASVRAHASFSSRKSSTDPVTRRDRLRFLMLHFRSVDSETELEVAEKAYAYVLAVDDQLTSAAHARGEPDAQSVKESLDAAESVLRRLVVPAVPPS
jgi:DNA-binding PadR family transcriptional regulator